jgi:hypothetical protein
MGYKLEEKLHLEEHEHKWLNAIDLSTAVILCVENGQMRYRLQGI